MRSYLRRMGRRSPIVPRPPEHPFRRRQRLSAASDAELLSFADTIDYVTRDGDSFHVGTDGRTATGGSVREALRNLRAGYYS